MKKYDRTCAVVLWNNGRLLLCKRINTDTFDGYWGCPGGKIEDNELPTEAIQREVEEEVDIYVEEERFRIVDCMFRDPSTDKFFMFEVLLPDDLVPAIKNTEPDKHTDWEWVTPEEARTKILMPGIIEYLNLMEKLGRLEDER